MKIGVDIDGVLADFVTPYKQLIIRVTGRDLFGPTHVATCWEFEREAGYTSEEIHKAWVFIRNSQSWWRNLPPYPKTASALQALECLTREGHEIYFITSRPESPRRREQTIYWLRHFGYAPWPTVIFAEHKGDVCKVLGLDAHLDDRWEELESIRVCGVRAVRLRRPWNISSRRIEALQIETVGCVEEFIELLGLTPQPATAGATVPPGDRVAAMIARDAVD